MDLYVAVQAFIGAVPVVANFTGKEIYRGDRSIDLCGATLLSSAVVPFSSKVICHEWLAKTSIFQTVGLGKAVNVCKRRVFAWGLVLRSSKASFVAASTSGVSFSNSALKRSVYAKRSIDICRVTC